MVFYSLRFMIYMTWGSGFPFLEGRGEGVRKRSSSLSHFPLTLYPHPRLLRGGGDLGISVFIKAGVHDAKLHEVSRLRSPLFFILF